MESSECKEIKYIIGEQTDLIAVLIGIESVALGGYSLLKSISLEGNDILSAIGIGLSSISIYMFFALRWEELK